MFVLELIVNTNITSFPESNMFFAVVISGVRTGELIIPLAFDIVNGQRFMKVLAPDGAIGWTSCVKHLWSKVCQ